MLFQLHENLSKLAEQLEVQIQESLGFPHLHDGDLDVLPANGDMVQQS